jgi:hypothetical protein
MHLKVFLKLKKTLRPSILGKKPSKPKKTHWAGLKKKTRVFCNPASTSWLIILSGVARSSTCVCRLPSSTRRTSLT